MLDIEKAQLIGDRFVINIAAPDSKGGIIVLNKDPRKARVKPDVYFGKVERVGPQCRFVKEGMQVSVKRWDYNQNDVDDERVMVRERELLVMSTPGEGVDVIPAPNTVIMQIKEIQRPSNLIVPETIRKPKPMAYTGRVIAANCWEDWGEQEIRIQPGMILWVERREANQFFLRPEVMVFKNIPDSWNGDRPILMIGESAPLS